MHYLAPSAGHISAEPPSQPLTGISLPTVTRVLLDDIKSHLSVLRVSAALMLHS